MLDALATEKRNSKTMNLDTYSVKEIINKMNQEDDQVAKAVKSELDSITKLVEAVIQEKNDGCLFYIGAGTSGRLGVLDATECIPTLF